MAASWSWNRRRARRSARAQVSLAWAPRRRSVPAGLVSRGGGFGLGRWNLGAFMNADASTALGLGRGVPTLTVAGDEGGIHGTFAPWRPMAQRPARMAGPRRGGMLFGRLDRGPVGALPRKRPVGGQRRTQERRPSRRACGSGSTRTAGRAGGGLLTVCVSAGRHRPPGGLGRASRAGTRAGAGHRPCRTRRASAGAGTCGNLAACFGEASRGGVVQWRNRGGDDAFHVPFSSRPKMHVRIWPRSLKRPLGPVRDRLAAPGPEVSVAVLGGRQVTATAVPRGARGLELRPRLQPGSAGSRGLGP